VHFESTSAFAEQRTWPGLPLVDPRSRTDPNRTLEHVIFGGLRLIESIIRVMIRTGNKRGIIDRSRNTRNALRPQRGRQCRLSSDGDGPVDIIMVPGSFHILNSVTNCPVTPLICAASRTSHAWWRSIKEVRDYRTGYLTAPSLEQRMDDVSRHYGCYRLATSNGVRTFRRLRDERFVRRYISRARFQAHSVWGLCETPRREYRGSIRTAREVLGTGAMLKRVAPSLAADPAAVAQFAKFERLSASPGAVKAFTMLNSRSMSVPSPGSARSDTRASQSRRRDGSG